MSGRDQVLEFLARLMTKVPWAKVDGSVLQLVINEFDRVVPEFVQFLANGGRCVPLAPEVKAEPPPPTFRLTKTFVVVEVDKDDPDNRNIPKQGGEIYYVDEDLKPKHFPIRGKGKVKRTFRYLECDQKATTEQWLEAIKQLKAENPDLADTRAFHKANPDERNQAPVASLCGEFEDRGDDRYVAYVYADDDGLYFNFFHLQGQWSQRIRVLVLSE